MSRDQGITYHEPVSAAQEAEHAFHAGVLPVEFAVRRGGEQGVHARGISTKTSDHIIGGNHIPLALGHLGAIFDYHALSKEAKDRLVMVNNSQIAHESRPEARVDQVRDGVLHAADGLIDWEPVIDGCGIWRAVFGLRVAGSLQVPR